MRQAVGIVGRSVRILSSQSDSYLEFFGLEGDDFGAAFRIGDARIGLRVWCGDGGGPLVELFRSIARDWRGWDEPRSWRSREGGLRLTCTSDRLGHVTLEVTMTGFEKPEPWRFAATLVVDPGQLDRIANEVQEFFSA